MSKTGPLVTRENNFGGRPLIFNIIIFFSPLRTNMCISWHVSSRRLLITVRPIGHSRTVSSQHGNCFMPSFRGLPFGNGSYISGKFVRPCLSRITSYCTANINAILCSWQCIIVLQDFQSRTPIYTVKSVENGKRTEQKRLSPTTHK